MKEITIDCEGIGTARQLHQALAEQLDFPDWYGGNLDALHDLLTAITEDTGLTLLHLETLGRAALGFRRVLHDAEKENPHFNVTIQ